MVALNRAVAVAEAGRLDEALALIDGIEGLEQYHLLYATRAELLRRTGRDSEAAAAYQRALELARNPVEREFLEGRLEEVAKGAGGRASP